MRISEASSSQVALIQLQFSRWPGWVDTFLTLHCIPQSDVSVVTLFCTQEHGLLLQDCFPKPSGLQALLALDVPHYYFSCKVKRDAILHACACSSSAVCFFHHCSRVFGLKTHPAVISEGVFLPTGSKWLSPARKTSVFWIVGYKQLCLVLRQKI